MYLKPKVLKSLNLLVACYWGSGWRGGCRSGVEGAPLVVVQLKT